MSSRRELVLAAVAALVASAVPAAVVARNVAKPQAVGAGTVNILDGEPGEPEILLSPLTYCYDHHIALELAAADETTIDAMLAAIGTAVMADRTLSGLCEFLDTDAPATGDIDAEGADPARYADLAIIASYTTTNPLL